MFSILVVLLPLFGEQKLPYDGKNIIIFHSRNSRSLIFPLHVVPSPVHPTGLSFYIFSGLLAIYFCIHLLYSFSCFTFPDSSYRIVLIYLPLAIFIVLLSINSLSCFLLLFLSFIFIPLLFL